MPQREYVGGSNLNGGTYEAGERMSKIPIILLCTLLSAITIFADQLVLKNGDRVTGKILRKDGDKIVVETESAGIISINWSAVDRIVSDQELNITLKDGQLLKGKVEPQNAEAVEVRTKDAGDVTVQRDNIAVVRNADEQLKFETERDRMLNPGFGDLWTGSADVGFSLTSGNSKTRAFTAGIRAARETSRDKISLYANAIQASNSTTGVSVTTAQAIWAGGRYDYNINRKLFAFGSADFEHDSPQLLSLRSVFGGGLGYRAIRSERTRLDIFGGGAYNMEFYKTGERRHSAELLVGDELNYKINPRMKFNQRLVVYPNVSSFGRFRSVLDASLITNINSWLGWHLTVSDRFNSDPVAGAKKNDLLFSTGIRVNFGNK